MTDFDESLMLPGIEKYAGQHSSPELPVLARLSRATHLRTHQPQMLSGHLQGVFLQMISHMIKPSAILEIGTFTGYSAICLAQGLCPGGKLITIDCNPEMEDFANPYFREAGLEDKIEMRVGDAASIIQGLTGPFDLVFIDADKESYVRYFELVYPMVQPGGYILSAALRRAAHGQRRDAWGAPRRPSACATPPAVAFRAPGRAAGGPAPQAAR